MKLISFVLPCHNEEKNLSPLIKEISLNVPKKYRFEVICVDDGSKDQTGKMIEQLSKKHTNIRGILFHRNFGHQKALMAGILHSQGDAVITMDADFQHPPKTIPKLIALWEKGHDLVRTQKASDNNASLRMKILRKVGYPVWEWVTDRAIIPGGSDFRLMSKEVTQYIREMNESEFFLRGNVQMASKNPTVVKYHVSARKFGRSSYSIKMFIDMFINGFVSFSTRPLRAMTTIGVLIFLITACFIFVDLTRALILRKKIIEGWVTGISLTVLLNSIIMIHLGILSEYIAVIFKEVKRRPRFMIAKKINFEPKK